MTTTQTQVRSTEEALKLALEALNLCPKDILFAKELKQVKSAITAIKEALAHPEQEPSYATTWLSGHAQGLEDGVAMKLEKPSVTPFGLPLFWDAPAPRPDGSLINEGTKNIEQEPVEMYRSKCADGSRCLHGCHTNEPCYTTPPQRTWGGLTDEEIDEIEEATWDEAHKSWGIHDFARAIEAKLKAKNERKEKNNVSW